MQVISREEAWKKVNEIFPTNYEKDEAASERAGYDIYRNSTLNYYCRICDLGCRLEVITGEYGENKEVFTMTNFERVTSNPKALSDFLSSLPVIEGPLRDCDNCPCEHYRNNYEWWLALEAGKAVKE